jgi:hypothetical protein
MPGRLGRRLCGVRHHGSAPTPRGQELGPLLKEGQSLPGGRTGPNNTKHDPYQSHGTLSREPNLSAAGGFAHRPSVFAMAQIYASSGST